MSDLKVKVSNFDDVPDKIGLKDGGHIILSCSNCGQELVDVWKIKENVRLKWKARAKCWKCGDQSFVREWTGHWALGHAGKDRPGLNPDGALESKILSSVVRIEPQDGMLIFHTKKAN